MNFLQQLRNRKRNFSHKHTLQLSTRLASNAFINDRISNNTYKNSIKQLPNGIDKIALSSFSSGNGKHYTVIQSVDEHNENYLLLTKENFNNINLTTINLPKDDECSENDDKV